MTTAHPLAPHPAPALSRRADAPLSARAGPAARQRIPPTTGCLARLRLALGVCWLLDGLLQLQPFMFRSAFAATVLRPNAAGQPRIVGAPILVAAHLVARHPLPWNLAFAGVQLAIGLGLLSRRTQRWALAASFAWALGIWWLGEGLGGILAGTASPLTGAPGAALLYGALGLVAWPGLQASTARAVARGLWCAVWCGWGVLWYLPANRAPGGVRDAIAASALNAPTWLHGMLAAVARVVGMGGLGLAALAATVCVVVGAGVATRRPLPFVAVGIVLATLAWVVGQSAGGLSTGQATDPNTGPLVVLLGAVLLPPIRAWEPARRLALPLRRLSRIAG